MSSLEDRRPGRRVFDPELISTATHDLHHALDAAGFADPVEGWVDGQSRAIAERLVRAGWVSPSLYEDELLRLRDQVDRARDVRNRAVRAHAELRELVATKFARSTIAVPAELRELAKAALERAEHQLNPPATVSGPADITLRPEPRRCESTVNGQQCLLNEHDADVDHQTQTHRAPATAFDSLAPTGEGSPGA